MAFIRDHHAADFLNRSEEAVLVQRLQDARIHRLPQNAFSRPRLGSSQRAGHLNRSGDDRNIRPFAPHGRSTEKNFIVAVRHWATLLRMDRIFKPPYSMTGAISQHRKSCQFLFWLMKNPLLYR
jgi:hypothetical protein